MPQLREAICIPSNLAGRRLRSRPGGISRKAQQYNTGAPGTAEEGRSSMIPVDAASVKPGYLGLIKRKIELDWKAIGEHGPCVLVMYRTPGWKAGLRSGDFITSINGLAYDAFHSAPPAAGTPFTIVAWRRGLGRFNAFGTVGIIPKTPKRSDPATPPGKSVTKQERPLFVHGFISKHPLLEAIDTRLLTLLLNHEGPKGIFPKRRTLARTLRRSLSTLDRALARCKRAGVLRVDSGKAFRTSNTYFVTWPLDHERSRGWNG
jgi:hypothetical protein